MNGGNWSKRLQTNRSTSPRHCNRDSWVRIRSRVEGLTSSRLIGIMEVSLAEKSDCEVVREKKAR